MGQKKGDKDTTGEHYVICPVLGSLIAEGSLHEDKDGNISLAELNDVMQHRLGISKGRAEITIGTGPLGQHLGDFAATLGGKFNINHLSGSFLDHQGRGDTGVLQGGTFHEDKLEALFAHSKDGKTLALSDFESSIDSQLERDKSRPGTWGKAWAEDPFEMAALINTFGTIDAKGERRIELSVVRDMFQNRKLPSKEALMSRPTTTLPSFVASLARILAGMPFAKTSNTTKKGAADATGGRASLADAALAGLGMALCPFMATQLGISPASIAELDRAHAGADHP